VVTIKSESSMQTLTGSNMKILVVNGFVNKD